GDVVDGDGGVVDRVDRDVHRGGVGRVQRAVIGVVGEGEAAGGVGGVGVGRGHEVHAAAVGDEGGGAACACAHRHCRLLGVVVVDVGVSCRPPVFHCATLFRAGDVVDGDGGVVDRVDRDRERRRVGVDGAIVGLEGEGVRAVVVRRRGVGESRRRAREGAVG